MTDAASAAPTPATRTLCEPCASIQRDWRRAPGHVELIQGDNRKEARNERTVTVTRYRCERCGATWDYENNRFDQHVGWLLVTR